MLGTIVNYVAWYVFMFISVMWLLIMLKNRHNHNNSGLNESWFPRVSVLIPAYNEERYLAKTVNSILSLNYPRKLLDIIIINDCSKDGTRRIAEGFRSSGVRVFNNRVNMGKAASLNRVLPLCRGELVACIDADSTAEPAVLKKMTGYFRNPKIAAVTPALKVENARNTLEKAQYAEYMLNILLRKMLALIDSVHVTPGVFSIYRKNVLLKLGGFDTDNLTEDMEIALR
ncbi:MAG: glycosyltransferase family 2 protein, partial [Candidatus Aenigmarchaeota archaeon]|nr:glycosyltransferase family 2 protein [Candidatus Aenigmarchaeota archaeon]